MIDTHAHLDFENFDEDREEVISRAFDNGVKKIVNIGVDLETSKKSVALAQKHDEVFSSVGIHPEYFSKDEKDLRFTIYDLRKNIDELRSLAGNKKVVAIGECGLDYFSHNGEIISDKQKENQKKGFLAQIELARELGLSVIVHCREAWEDLHDIILNFSQSSAFPFLEQSSRNSSKPSFSKFVLHCYSGNSKDTEKFLKLPNVHFSFSGNITYPKPIERAEKLAEAVRMVPLGKIMLDSDSPLLAPQAMRGKRNEPAFVAHIAEKIAEIKGISVSKVEKVTDENATVFFEMG